MTADCGKLLGGEIQSCHRSSLDQPALQRITYISQSAPLLAMAKVKATQAICPGSDNGEMAGAAFCPCPRHNTAMRPVYPPLPGWRWQARDKLRLEEYSMNWRIV